MKKPMKTRILSTLMTLALCLTLLPTAVFAEGETGSGASDAIPYLDADGTPQTCDNYTVLDSDYVTAHTDDSGSVSLSAGWYVVQGTVPIFTSASFQQTLEVTGDVHLILCNNAVLTVNSFIYLDTDASLTIYAQSTGTAMGQLNANTGILGKSNNSLTVNGGSITAKDSGIDTMLFGISVGDMTVNGGIVTANGGAVENKDYYDTKSYGIFAENSLTIHGGTVTATGGTVTLSCSQENSINAQSTGILVRGDCTISGGTVTATGSAISATSTAGKNALASSYGIYATGKLTVSGAATTLTANANAAAASSNNASANLNSYSFGIYALEMAVTGGTVDTTSGTAKNQSYGIYVTQGGQASSGTGSLTVSGGSVSGTSGAVTKYGEVTSAGIFAFTLTISGQNTTVTGQGGEIAEDTDQYGIATGNMTVSEGTITATDSQIFASQATISGGDFTGHLIASSGTTQISGGSFSELKCLGRNNYFYPVALLLAEGYELVLEDGTVIYAKKQGSTTAEDPTIATNAIARKHDHNFTTLIANNEYQCDCGATNAQQSVAYLDGAGHTAYCSDYTVADSNSSS